MSSAAPEERVAMIDDAAIRHNIAVIADYVRPARLMAAVKADGYGHGLVAAAQAAQAGGADWLGVAHVQEALALREAGIEGSILAWLHTVDTDFRAAVNAHIDVGVSGWELDPIAEAAEEQQRPARVHLKVDTGLHRNGCRLQDWPELVQRAARLQEEGLLSIDGIFTHLAVADEPDRQETDLQLQRYREALQIAESYGVDPALRHVANTPAALTRPDAHFDMVRVGVGIYGQSPFADRSPESLGLRPAMELRSSVVQIKMIEPGEGIGYGLTHRVAEPGRLALIPLGYADGIPRNSVGAPVLIRGQRFYSVGRVAMDQFMVDLGRNSSVRTGDPVTLFGGDSGISAADWAQAAGTINYEIITRIGPRVPRRVVNNEQELSEAEEAIHSIGQHL